jgi:hypothetical protein
MAVAALGRGCFTNTFKNKGFPLLLSLWVVSDRPKPLHTACVAATVQAPAAVLGTLFTYSLLLLTLIIRSHSLHSYDLRPCLGLDKNRFSHWQKSNVILRSLLLQAAGPFESTGIASAFVVVPSLLAATHTAD